MKPIRHLDRAIAAIGSQTALADGLHVRQSLISMWKNRGRVPAEYCPSIEQITKGFVRCEDLRPDVAWSVVRAKAA